MLRFLYASILLAFVCTQKLQAQELVIISPHWEGIRYEFENAFNNWRKNNNLQEVNFIWKQVGGTSEILRFVQSEFQIIPDSRQAGIGVDIVFGGGVDPFESFKKDQLLQTYKPSAAVLSKLPIQVSGAPIYDSDYSWFAPTLSAFGIFCNHKVLEKLGLEKPHSWDDLAKPEFASWIVSADPRKSGSAHMYYEIILQAYGWEAGWQILFDLAKNYRTFLSASSQVALDVAYGEVACGFLLDSQAKVQMQKFNAADFSFSIPRGKSLYAGDALAILKGAKNLDLAQQFVEFMLSEQAQKLWYLPVGYQDGPVRYALNRLPVYPDLFQNKLISDYNPFDLQQNQNNLIFSNEKSSARWEILNDLLGIFLIESFDFKKLDSPACRTKLPKLSEIDQLVSANTWNNQVLKNNIISEWRNNISDCLPSAYWAGLPFFLIMAILVVIKKCR